MITWKKITLVILSTILVLGIIFIVVFIVPFFFTDDMCKNRIISSTSIDGTIYKIIIFERDCGATTDFSTQASILKQSEELPNEGGNIFIVDTDHGKAPSGPGGGPELRIRILAKDTLELAYDYRVRIFSQERTYKDIKIKYVTFGAS